VLVNLSESIVGQQYAELLPALAAFVDEPARYLQVLGELGEVLADAVNQLGRGDAVDARYDFPDEARPSAQLTEDLSVCLLFDVEPSASLAEVDGASARTRSDDFPEDCRGDVPSLDVAVFSHVLEHGPNVSAKDPREAAEGQVVFPVENLEPPIAFEVKRAKLVVEDGQELGAHALRLRLHFGMQVPDEVRAKLKIRFAICFGKGIEPRSDVYFADRENGLDALGLETAKVEHAG